MSRDSHRRAAAAPVPRQQLVETTGWVTGDAGEGVREPRLGIDVVELGGLDQGVEDRRPLAAAVGAAEQERSKACC